ncbi:MAG: RagB/SusD family nutrient uptake outer membrane protein [Proteiniphilum sp.]
MKTKINSIKLIFVALIAGIMFYSCQEFLEEHPTGTLTDEAQITSQPGGDALATGAYRALPDWTGGGNVWGSSLPGSLEYPTGKAYSQYMGADLWKYETDIMDGTHPYFTYIWNNWYRGVRDANLAIKMLPDVSQMTEEQISKRMGEARTLRAFYYFCLTRLYGDVIANTTILENVNDAQQPRTSLVNIYDKIIVPDLEFAVNESALEDTRSTDGRVTKYVARAILADVYLTMAGYPYQEARTDTTKNWCETGSWAMTEYPVNTQSAKDLLQKAKTQLDFLNGKYPLGDFGDLNNPEMDNQGGAIFQVQYVKGVRENGLIDRALPLTMQISNYDIEAGTFVPSTEYLESYDPADIRMQERVYFYSTDTRAAKYDPNESPAPKFATKYLQKYYDKSAIKGDARSGLNFTLYRYADILLMQTEVNWALNSLGVSVPNNDIVKGINEIRRRAGLAEYSASGLTLLDIMSERAYELVYENKMLWDQRRTRKVLIDGSGAFSGIENFVGHQPSHFNFDFSTKHLLSPISGTEIDNNRKCTQNFEWLPLQKGE